VFSTATRRFISCLALGFSAWFALDAVSGVFFYASQGDLCRKVQKQLEAVPQGHWASGFEICAKRTGVVYRAFILELLVAVVLVVFAARGLLWKSKRPPA